MKDQDLLDAIGDINEKYIRGAAHTDRVRRRKTYIWWSAAAACLCIAALAVVLWRTGTTPPAADAKTGETSSESTEPVEEELSKQESEPEIQEQEGVYVPAVELPEKQENADADMIGLVVYQNGIYTQADDYYGAEAERIDPLVGEHLGTASGSINCLNGQDPEAYSTEFASTFEGEVYTVKGYDPDFRICIRREAEDENGEPSLWIEFLERVNDITLTTGKDLFEDRLHLNGRIEQVLWQSHDDWNNGRSNLQNASMEDPSTWETFLEETEAGEWIYTWDPKAKNSIYDTDKQAHVLLDLDDGSSVKIRLIEGGYVGYDGLGWYFVKIPAEVFDPVYTACGGQ